MRFQHIPGLVRLGGYVTARHNRGVSDSATTPPRKPDEPQVTSATPEEGAPLPQITTKQAARINAPIHGTLGLGAVQGVLGNADLTHGVVLNAVLSIFCHDP